MREYEDETLLIANNLSRYVQPAELDLRQFKNRLPMELVGGVCFPKIGDLPYFLTFSPHAFYWFQLMKVEEPGEIAAEAVEKAAQAVHVSTKISGTTGRRKKKRATQREIKTKAKAIISKAVICF